MALIEVFHTMATSLNTNPAQDVATTPIIEGMAVTLVGGFVARTSGGTCVGIAGDSMSTTGFNSSPGSATGNSPFAAALVIGATGVPRYTTNRVSDFYNETTASGKMTVYTGVGEFWTDQFLTTGVGSIGTSDVGGPVFAGANGLLVNASVSSGRRIGTLLEASTAYPSGVPGVQARGSMTLGNFVRFSLNC